MFLPIIGMASYKVTIKWTTTKDSPMSPTSRRPMLIATCHFTPAAPSPKTERSACNLCAPVYPLPSGHLLQRGYLMETRGWLGRDPLPDNNPPGLELPPDNNPLGPDHKGSLTYLLVGRLGRLQAG